MRYGIDRGQALALVHEKISHPNLIKHSLAAEAVMGALADHLGEDREKWSLAGLLHDLDAESRPDLAEHTRETAAILRERGVDSEIVEAIMMHNEEAHGRRREGAFQHALASGETMTGLIIATALVYPDRTLGSVKVKSILKRMKEKAFAAGANREIIRECEKIGIPIGDFCEICLQAMQEISEDLDL